MLFRYLTCRCCVSLGHLPSAFQFGESGGMGRRRHPRSGSWRVDETYVKVLGKWAYLYRAVDKLGSTIDFYPSPTRNTAAAKRFLAKALRGLKDWERPEVINTDKARQCQRSRFWILGAYLCTHQVDGRVVDRHAAFGHHLLEIAIADAVAAIPAHRPEHNLAAKVAPLEIRHGPAPLARAFHRKAPKALQQSRRAHPTVSNAEIPVRHGRRNRHVVSSRVLWEEQQIGVADQGVASPEIGDDRPVAVVVVSHTTKLEASVVAPAPR